VPTGPGQLIMAGVNIQQLPAQEAVAAALVARRREYAAALRACRPHERKFLKQLPKSRYAPYTAGLALGVSDSTVWKMLNRPRVKRAMELFLRDALDDIGVSHVSLVADLLEIKERCMQSSPVLDRKGNPTGEYQFDSHGAIAAIKELAELLHIAGPKRVELTGLNGGPIETVTTHITEDMDAEEAARVYQDLIRTH
jgi:hypothetical protein